MRCLEIEAYCENLQPGDYDQENVSDQSEEYNCIAWALGKKDKPWWPLKDSKRYHWPSQLPREEAGRETLDNFIRAFRLEGYQTCKSHRLRKGFEKVAIFASASGNPLHAARQLSSGRWTSKCGDYEDINHITLSAVEGRNYGMAVAFLERRTDQPLSPLDRVMNRLIQMLQKYFP
jgi:hypothetical protein